MLYLELKKPDGTYLREEANATADLMAIGQLHWPHAVRKQSWDMVGHDLNDRWRYAFLAIWPNSTAMELDAARFGVIATITNDDDGPPEPNARMFLGPNEIVNPSDCSNPSHEDDMARDRKPGRPATKADAAPAAEATPTKGRGKPKGKAKP